MSRCAYVQGSQRVKRDLLFGDKFMDGKFPRLWSLRWSSFMTQGVGWRVWGSSKTAWPLCLILFLFVCWLICFCFFLCLVLTQGSLVKQARHPAQQQNCIHLISATNTKHIPKYTFGTTPYLCHNNQKPGYGKIPHHGCRVANRNYKN